MCTIIYYYCIESKFVARGVTCNYSWSINRMFMVNVLAWSFMIFCLTNQDPFSPPMKFTAIATSS